jgi:hypothetical protein
MAANDTVWKENAETDVFTKGMPHGWQRGPYRPVAPYLSGLLLALRVGVAAWIKPANGNLTHACIVGENLVFAPRRKSRTYPHLAHKELPCEIES